MKKRWLAALLAVQTFAMPCFAGELPEGWFRAGSSPSSYKMELVQNEGVPAPSVVIASKEDLEIEGFGTVMQNFYPKSYLGKRVKLTAWVKAEDVADWAGVWMRVDGENRKVLAFDNMFGRHIKGTSDWTEYTIVLDVDKAASNLAYGVLLSGEGTVYIDKFNFTLVDDSVPVTGKKRVLEDGPKNTSF
ncbi:hypothetical protein [Pleionea sp. CnH1-48]|uniref:hypothetical protein n=1 Tax=Pleionea sp. CnH1-48 TaxID=2954494 RepID=UPI0020975B3C|nr:hypothetical protein [Pleionea sp. CnH1-48]MCO7223036.1 hypothetical protein [Pleionea sp. CnH1-48]